MSTKFLPHAAGALGLMLRVLILQKACLCPSVMQAFIFKLVLLFHSQFSCSASRLKASHPGVVLGGLLGNADRLTSAWRAALMYGVACSVASANERVLLGSQPDCKVVSCQAGLSSIADITYACRFQSSC